MQSKNHNKTYGSHEKDIQYNGKCNVILRKLKVGHTMLIGPLLFFFRALIKRALLMIGPRRCVNKTLWRAGPNPVPYSGDTGGVEYSPWTHNCHINLCRCLEVHHICPKKFSFFHVWAPHGRHQKRFRLAKCINLPKK